ncbi:MAG: replication restart helicase PriA, partial [Planctomycetia bacterium]
TPQTISRFRSRFGEVAVLHSHLTDVDRHYHWRRIAAGEVRVVVGARSALFAPCRRLGLLVIDEEHETTFKQESAPRYHARDVAVKRSQLEGVPLILGSATPSLETWQAAVEAGRFTRLSLPNRVGDAPMPAVALVDLRQEYKKNRSTTVLSRPLALAMEQTLAVGGQVILLLNRRGYSTSLLCPSCGAVAMCKHCEISLTFHREWNRLLCHSCDADFAVPEQCAKCQAPAIYFSGVGTERLEAEVRRRFPDAKVARMDSDVMRTPASYERVLDAFKAGDLNILLGTQMIAKGLDFPNVRLVGVVSADTARNLPDFRAAERTFQLVTQVAGRAGRGDALGRVLIQTFNPEDPSIQAASRHDYDAFMRGELPIRKEFGYPPYSGLTRVVLRGPVESVVAEAAKSLAERFRAAVPAVDAAAGNLRILGPAPAPVSKLRDLYRFHFQIHSALDADRHALLHAALDDFKPPPGVEWIVDVDPSSML